MPRRTHGMGGMRECDFLDLFQNPRHAEARVLAHGHRGRSGMTVLAGDRYLRPAEALAVGDHADILALGLQNRALLDMQLEKGMHLARADLFLAAPADPVQFVAETLALGILAAFGPVLIVHAGEHA